MDGAGNVTGGVEEGVFIRLDHPDLIVLEVLFNPVGADEHLGMGITTCGNLSHLEPRNWKPLLWITANRKKATGKPVAFGPNSRGQRYANAPPTMILRMRSHGEPCEMLLVCVG